MTNLKTKPDLNIEDPNDPNVRDPEHKHELGGTLGMTVGGLAAGIGAGAAAGATIGGIGGPIGVVAGAAVGGAIGGVVGEKIAREVNPTAEEEYWEKNYRNRPYVKIEHDFSAYRPAYRSGVEAYQSNPQASFDDLEPSLRNNWDIKPGNSKLEWNEARQAAKDAFGRLSDSPDFRE